MLRREEPSAVGRWLEIMGAGPAGYTMVVTDKRVWVYYEYDHYEVEYEVEYEDSTGVVANSNTSDCTDETCKVDRIPPGGSQYSIHRLYTVGATTTSCTQHRRVESTLLFIIQLPELRAAQHTNIHTGAARVIGTVVVKELILC